MKPEYCYVCRRSYVKDDGAWVAAPIGDLVVFLCGECGPVFYPPGSYPNDLKLPPWVERLVERAEKAEALIKKSSL